MTLEERHREHASSLCSRSDRGRGGVIASSRFGQHRSLAGRLTPSATKRSTRSSGSARTQNRWLDKPVSPALLMAVYDLMRMGPTSANVSPARIHFVVSKEAKERLRPYLLEGNREKTMSAPVTAIIGYDLEFAQHLPKLFPRQSRCQGLVCKSPACRGHRVSKWHPAGRLFYFGGALPRAGYRPDVRLRQFRRRSRILFRHENKVEFPLQHRTWRSCGCSGP